MEELRQSQQSLAESARRLREMMNQKSDIVPGLQGEPMKSSIKRRIQWAC